MPRGKAKTPEAKLRQLQGLRQFQAMPEALTPEMVGVAPPVKSDSIPPHPGYQVKLPDGHTITVFTADERQFIKSRLKIYSESFDWEKHPDDLHKLIVLEWRFYQLEGNRKADRETVSLQSALSGEIRLLKEKLGITKAQLGGEQETPFGLIERVKREAREFIEARKGQFEWKCAHCGGMNLMEVPHFAFDPMCAHGTWDPHGNFVEDHAPQDCPKKLNYGSHGVWNNEIGVLVRQRVLTPAQAAAILKISPIAFLAVAQSIGFDLGMVYDLNAPETVEVLLRDSVHNSSVKGP